MRTAVLTLGITLAAAVAVWLGGVRLARREAVSRTPADRIRLQEFTDALHGELERLTDLYTEHLAGVVQNSNPRDPIQARAICATVAGVRGAEFFLDRTAAPRMVRSPGDDPSPWPEVVIEGGKDPLNRARAIIVPREVMAGELSHGWLRSPDHAWLIRWEKTPGVQLAVVFIDAAAVRRVLDGYLSQWLPAAFAPLRQAGELVCVRSEKSVLAGLTTPPPGPIALTVPLRTALGQWEVSAWDRVSTRVEYEPSTMAVAITGGALLAGLGALLFWQQRRALRLAEERVSFVNRVSHEFSAPLTNALLNLSLADDALESQPARARARLRLVTEEMQRLSRMAANVLTFSRRERAALTLQPGLCVPDDVVAEVAAQFEPALARRGLRLEWRRGAAGGAMLCSDALGQIVGNLISNVEKYAFAGGWLGLETVMESGELVVRVLDRGPGIPAADGERIFEPFERVNSRVNEGSSGAGLGLAIARDLAQRMGGALTLLPVEQGACFELRIPAPGVVTAMKKEDAA